MVYDPKKQTPHERFGLDPKADEAEIKAAYAVALKANRPEGDLNTFALLRQDYKWLRQQAKFRTQDSKDVADLTKHRTVKANDPAETNGNLREHHSGARNYPEYGEPQSPKDGDPILRESAEETLERARQTSAPKLSVEEQALADGFEQSRAIRKALIDLLPPMLDGQQLSKEQVKVLGVPHTSQIDNEVAWRAWTDRARELSLADGQAVENALLWQLGDRLRQHVNADLAASSPKVDQGTPPERPAAISRKAMNVWKEVYAWHKAPQDFLKQIPGVAGTRFLDQMQGYGKNQPRREVQVKKESGWHMLWRVPLFVISLVVLFAIIAIRMDGSSSSRTPQTFSERLAADSNPAGAKIEIDLMTQYLPGYGPTYLATSGLSSRSHLWVGYCGTRTRHVEDTEEECFLALNLGPPALGSALVRDENSSLPADPPRLNQLVYEVDLQPMFDNFISGSKSKYLEEAHVHFVWQVAENSLIPHAIIGQRSLRSYIELDSERLEYNGEVYKTPEPDFFEQFDYTCAKGHRYESVFVSLPAGGTRFEKFGYKEHQISTVNVGETRYSEAFKAWERSSPPRPAFLNGFDSEYDYACWPLPQESLQSVADALFGYRRTPDAASPQKTMITAIESGDLASLLDVHHLTPCYASATLGDAFFDEERNFWARPLAHMLKDLGAPACPHP